MTKSVFDVTHPDEGHTTRHIVSTYPARIGRAFDNDIILDDVYVDPHHAVIQRAPDNGDLFIHDLGSQNGIIDNHHTTHKLRLVSGHSFTLGRTEIRHYSVAHNLASTLKLEKPRAWQRHVQQPFAVWPLFLLTIAFVTGWSYLNIWSDEIAPALSSAAVIVGSGILIWSAAWALVGRILRRRAFFNGQIAVASLYTLACCILWSLQAYVNFFTNENWAAQVFDYALSFLILSSLLSAALSFATTMLPKKRRAAAMIAAAGVLFGSLAFSLINQKSFDPSPHYASGIEPYLTSMVSAQTPDVIMTSNEKLFKSKVFEHKSAEKP